MPTRLSTCAWKEIQTAGVADHTWVLAARMRSNHVRSILPDAILAAGIGNIDNLPSPAALVADGYRVVNSVYSLSNRRIHAYQDAGLWVNLWVVDETWQHSRLWLVGANSVTSQLRSDIRSHVAPGRGDHISSLSGYLGGGGLAGSLAVFFEEALSVLCDVLWNRVA